MFAKPAFAEATTVATNASVSGGDLLNSLFPIILILIVFYVVVIRPQNKRLQEHRKMIANLQKGDKVVTGGGLIGTVKKIVSDDEVVLELSEGVQVHAVRSTIMIRKD
jgi:preprotein translocase subunit YajC